MKFKNSLKQRILIKPFIYKRESLSVQSLKIICLLMIQVLMLLFTKTYNSFVLVLVSVAASVLSELFVSKCFFTERTFIWFDFGNSRNFNCNDDSWNFSSCDCIFLRFFVDDCF